MYRNNPVYWGKAGAGIMFFCENEVLLVLRSYWVSQPNTWGIPGGSVAGEDYYDSEDIIDEFEESVFWNGAIKEVEQELGSLPGGEIADVFDRVVYEDGGFKFITYLVKISPTTRNEWEITLEDGENSDYGWFSVLALPTPLHSGVQYLLQEMNWCNPSQYNLFEDY